MNTPLPQFERPPVVEVAMSVQFAALDLPGVRLGSFWESIREQFPDVQEQPPLPPMREDFGGLAMPTFSVQFMGGPPSPRYWLLSPDSSRLLQVQRDRVGYNWRRRADDAEYPSYEVIREEFDELFAQFRAFVASDLQAEVAIECVDLVYVNQIKPHDDWGSADFYRVLGTFAEPGKTFLPDVEGANGHWQYVIGDQKAGPIGRLHVDVGSGFTIPEMTPVINVNVTARGASGQALGFLDVAHEWIVRGFTELTTKSMHTEWGRIR